MTTLKVTYFQNENFGINEDAFDGKLLSSTIGETETVLEFDSLTHIGSNAIHGGYLKDVIVPPSVTRIEKDAVSYFNGKIIAECIGEDYLEIVDGELVACFYRGWDKIDITVPEGVTVIGKNAFKDVQVKKLIMPKSLKKFEARSVSTNALTSIKLNRGLEEMGEECLWGAELKTLTIPDTVTTIGDRAFGMCDELTKIKIGKGVTHIGDSILFRTVKLREINGKYATDDHLALIFDDRFIAYAVNAPEESYSIPEGIKVIGRGAFCGANHLKEVHIPDSVIDIEPQAFISQISRFYGKFTTPDNKCVIVGNRLIAFRFTPNGPEKDTFIVPECVTEICEDACKNCGNLASVVWHDGITKIGDRAFMNNHLMKLSPVLPAALEEIGREAFEDMWVYSDMAYFSEGVVVPPSVRHIGMAGLYAHIFWFSSENPPVWDYWDRLVVSKIFVPEHLIEKYKEAYPWYAEKIEEWEC